MDIRDIRYRSFTAGNFQQNIRVIRKAEFVGELGESNLASMKMDEEDDDDSDYSLDVTPHDIEQNSKEVVQLKN